MIIKLTKEQQDKLLAWSGEITKAHHLDGTMAPGYSLIIGVSQFGWDARAKCGSKEIDLGDVSVELED